MNFIEKLNGYIRATDAALYVVTPEEQRCINDIKSCISHQLQDHEIVAWSWTITGGLAKVHPHQEKVNNEDLEDPAGVLKFFYDKKGSEDEILLLMDFHHYIKDPVILRQLRDLFKVFKKRGSTVIFISPVMELPKDIEREVAVEEYDLPDKEVISERLDLVLQSLPDDIEQGIRDEMSDNYRSSVLDAALGMTSGEAENVFARSIAVKGELDVKNITDHKVQVIKRAGSLEWIDTNINMDDVGGLEVLKEWLGKRSRAFTKEAKEFGLPTPKGLMLTGISGCGKSLAAKAAGKHWNLPLLGS
jgi:hypothetical protein